MSLIRMIWSRAVGILQSSAAEVYSSTSTEIKLGTAYAAEMGISLFSEINRYTLGSIGNIYDFMVFCSTACDVELTQSRAMIEAMPNGSENLSVYSDNDSET